MNADYDAGTALAVGYAGPSLVATPGFELVEPGSVVRCESCDGGGKVSVPLVQSDPPGKAFDGTARSRLRARGDWDALEAQLEVLRSIRHPGFRSWVAIRVHGDKHDSAYVDGIDFWLLDRLPDPLRVPRDVMTAFEARQEREHMREAARRATKGRGSKRGRAAELLRMGYPIQEAARLAGCSVKTARRAAA